jgi:molybdenum cofactor guanylyltransferase
MDIETSAPLYGLVLAGGRSSRMGVDKGLIDYHGLPQREWLRDLLATRCARAFLSLNDAQAEALPDGACASVIVDDPRFETSPLGALLSASAAHPGAAWLLVSCDLAYFDAACLDALLSARDAGQSGTAYVIEDLGQPEPLATIYEAPFVASLQAEYAAGERSIRRALHRAGWQRVEAPGPKNFCVESVDTPQGAERAKRFWKDGGRRTADGR